MRGTTSQLPICIHLHKNTSKADDHPVEYLQLKILRDLSKKSNGWSREEGVGIRCGYRKFF